MDHTMPNNRIKFVLCALCGEPFELRRNNRRREYCRNECRLTVLRRASMARATARIRALERPGDGCWEYRDWAVNHNGYGRLWVGGKTVAAHRFAWILVAGPIPPGMEVLHTCDNRPCVRNDGEGVYEVNGVLHPRRGHLWLGTTRDNALDRDAKGRQRGNVKLDAADKARIRVRHAAGGVSMAALAREYRVCRPTIKRALGHQDGPPAPTLGATAPLMPI